MSASSENWEYGSELHLDWLAGPMGEREADPWQDRHRLYGSGRDALRALLQHGRATQHWKRLLVPSYLCQEVVASARQELPVVAYPDRPTMTEPAERSVAPAPGDVVLVVNTFGLRTARWALPAPQGVAVIEDHTHDPWSEWARTSRADYAIASLRKTLPLPDGGVLWSPVGQELPQPLHATPERQVASERKLAAQLLKALYLAGHAIEKETFRGLFVSGESGIATGSVSGMPAATQALLRVLPTRTWRERRRVNGVAAAQLLHLHPSVTLLLPEQGATAFSLVLVARDPTARESLRKHLIQGRIYPAVLWPLDEPEVDGIEHEALSLSRRVLSLHCDYRYSDSDLERVGTELTRWTETQRG